MLQRHRPLLRRTPLRWRRQRKAAPLSRRDPAAYAYLLAVHALPCYACLLEGVVTFGVHAHHSKTRPDGSSYGSGHATDYETIPLCEAHHANYGVAGRAFHAATTAWRARYGSELDAVAWTQACIKAGTWRQPSWAFSPLPGSL
jgi:hypothetical protein